MKRIVIFGTTLMLAVILTVTCSLPGDPLGNIGLPSFSGEGSSPGVIPPDYESRYGYFTVWNETRAPRGHLIESVTFTQGGREFRMGQIQPTSNQRIVLARGYWRITVEYHFNGELRTRYGIFNVLPASDPLAPRNNNLHFYLTTNGEIGISPTWPPEPNDADPEQLLPPCIGAGRGALLIINNSQATIERVVIWDPSDLVNIPPLHLHWSVDDESEDGGIAGTSSFRPPAPILQGQRGLVHVVGIPSSLEEYGFSIVTGVPYFIQIGGTTPAGEEVWHEVSSQIYNDRLTVITITQQQMDINSVVSSVITLNNETSGLRSANIIIVSIMNAADDGFGNPARPRETRSFGSGDWNPHGVVRPGDQNVRLRVPTSAVMPIRPGYTFGITALIENMAGDRVSAVILTTTGAVSLHNNNHTFTLTNACVGNDDFNAAPDPFDPSLTLRVLSVNAGANLARSRITGVILIEMERPTGWPVESQIALTGKTRVRWARVTAHRSFTSTAAARFQSNVQVTPSFVNQNTGGGRMPLVDLMNRHTNPITPGAFQQNMFNLERGQFVDIPVPIRQMRDSNNQPTSGFIVYFIQGGSNVFGYTANRPRRNDETRMFWFDPCAHREISSTSAQRYVWLPGSPGMVPNTMNYAPVRDPANPAHENIRPRIPIYVDAWNQRVWFAGRSWARE